MKTPCLQAIWLLALMWMTQQPASAAERCFPIGETLTYRLYWGIIPVGRARLSVHPGDEAGRKLLILRAEARTSAIVRKIYPVDDYIESIVDAETLAPVRYSHRLHEGRNTRHDTMRFEAGEGKIYWEDLLRAKHGTLDIEPGTRDVLSLAYSMRSSEFKVGDQKKFRVVVDNKLYDLEVTGLNVEDIKVEGVGKVECLKVEPKAKFSDIFVKKGKAWLWFSHDTRHICTLMGAEVLVASLKAVLVRVESPPGFAWPEKKQGGGLPVESRDGAEEPVLPDNR